MLSKILYLGSIFVEYIFNNNIQIDKATYVALLVGELTISAIYLAYCQFIFGAGDKDEVPFLGEKPFDFYIRHSMKGPNVIIRSKIFLVCILYQIFYKPIVVIFKDSLDSQVSSVMSFIWGASAGAFFAFFIYVILKCISVTHSAKGLVERKSRYLIYLKAKDFRKRARWAVRRKKPIERLECKIDWICRFLYMGDILNPNVETDPGRTYCYEYLSLIEEAFYKYKQELKVRAFWKKLFRKNSSEDNSNNHNVYRELKLIYDLAKEKYFHDDSYFQGFLIGWLSTLIDSNQESFMVQDENDEFGLMYNSIRDNERLVISIIDEIYHSNGTKVQKRLVDEFSNYSGVYQEDNIKNQIENLLINWEIHDLKDGRIDARSFKEVLHEIKYTQEFNTCYAERVFDAIVFEDSSKEFSMAILPILNADNANALFISLVLSYGWDRGNLKEVDIELLKKLHAKGKTIKNSREQTSKVLSNSYSNIYVKNDISALDYIIETVNIEVDCAWMKEIYEKYPKVAFYWIVVKILVIRNYVSVTSGAPDMDVLVRFINELSDHEELFAYKEMKALIRDMQTFYIISATGVPANLKYSFNSLMMLSVKIEEIDFNANPFLKFDPGVGQYVLMHLPEDLTGIYNKYPELIEAVKESYRHHDCSIDMYVDRICTKADALGEHILQARRDKMKQTLHEIINGAWESAVPPTPISHVPPVPPITATPPKPSKTLKKKDED